MPGCNNCKHFQSKLGEFVDGRFESIKKCSLGMDSSMEGWWKENAHKVVGKGDVLTDMSCHENHEITTALDKTVAALDKMLEKLNKRDK